VCGICGKINENYLCKECEKAIKLLEINKLVFYKKEDSFFYKHMYIFNYEGIIRKNIINYKFNDKSYMYKTFEKIILNNKKVCDFINSYDIIIPVPIHNKRKLERGYNQTDLIVKKLVKDLKNSNNLIYGDNFLIKIKNNNKQSALNKEQRSRNVLNTYAVNEKIRNILNNKKILIFDDIYTTGSTLKECARVINRENPTEIGVLTIAKD